MPYYDRTNKSDKPSCAQCGSTTPENGFKTKEVTHQDRDPYTNKRCVSKSKFTVCAGTPCGAHLQMGYEG